jgi:hypothetical protein
MKIKKRISEDNTFTPYQLIIDIEDKNDEILLSSLKDQSLINTKNMLRGFDNKEDQLMADKVEDIINLIRDNIDKKFEERRNMRWGGVK